MSTSNIKQLFGTAVFLTEREAWQGKDEAFAKQFSISVDGGKINAARFKRIVFTPEEIEDIKQKADLLASILEEDDEDTSNT